jgi:RND family efflux transporter MFP subunit
MGRTLFFWTAMVLCVAAVGCGRRQPPAPATKPPEVVVSRPVVKEIIDYNDFTGRTEAVASVEVRARVTGYLDKVLFTEGDDVKQGQPLFEIDPRTYHADVNRADAVLQQAKARLARLELDFKRAAPLLPSQAISREDYDKIVGDREEGKAAVGIAEAARDLAQLNLGFTKVLAPISGRASRQLIDPGNMVKADETALTTIVTLDPIYAYFDVDERSVLKFRRLMEAGKVKAARDSVSPVQMGLVDEEDEKGNPLFPHAGVINFADNRVDAMTGTLRLRGKFDNPKHFLAPGLFVRVRVPIGTPHRAILISERALGNDQGQKFVYVVNDKSEVVYRRVTVGAMQDGLRVIDEGLAQNEQVVVDGLQRVRPGITVQPKPVETSPSSGPVTAPAAGKPAQK